MKHDIRIGDINNNRTVDDRPIIVRKTLILVFTSFHIEAFHNAEYSLHRFP